MKILNKKALCYKCKSGIIKLTSLVNVNRAILFRLERSDKAIFKNIEIIYADSMHLKNH